MAPAEAAKPRVCIVRQATYPHDLLVRREAETLRDAGFDVHVVCLRSGQAVTREDVNGVHVHRISPSRAATGVISYVYSYLRFFFLGALKVSLLHIGRRFNVIQVNTLPDFLVFSTVLPRLLGAKIVLVMYEPMPELWATLYGHKGMVSVIVILQKMALAYAHAVFAVTEQQKRTFVRRGADPAKVTVILNAPEPRLWGPIHLPDRKGQSSRHFTLICHGAIEERYGHDTMLQAVGRLKDRIPGLRLRILGKGSYVDEFLAMVRAMSLEEWVEYLGFVPMPVMVEELSRADAGIVAQKSSPYSNLVHTGKMYDYMAFRLPVIASRLDAVAAYFDEDSLQFFTPGDPASLAEAILDLYEHPQRRRLLVENSQKLYRRYAWEEQKRAYLEVFRRLSRRG